MKLVVINACVRQGDSRTLKIAEPVIQALAERYETVRYDLPEMEGVVPLTPALFAARGAGEVPAWAAAAAREIAAADRILLADTHAPAASWLASRMAPGDALLLKGSRAIAMEKIIPLFA